MRELIFLHWLIICRDCVHLTEYGTYYPLWPELKLKEGLCYGGLWQSVLLVGEEYIDWARYLYQR